MANRIWRSTGSDACAAAAGLIPCRLSFVMAFDSGTPTTYPASLHQFHDFISVCPRSHSLELIPVGSGDPLPDACSDAANLRKRSIGQLVTSLWRRQS